MAKAENIMKVFETGLPVAATAAAYTVGSELVLNRTALSAPMKGAAAGGVAVAGAMLAAGYAPRVAVGLLAGGAVYLGQTAARRAKLDALVDQWMSQARSSAQQAAQQQNAQATAQGSQNTQGTQTTQTTTPPAHGLPGPRGMGVPYMNAAGARVRR